MSQQSGIPTILRDAATGKPLFIPKPKTPDEARRRTTIRNMGRDSAERLIKAIGKPKTTGSVVALRLARFALGQKRKGGKRIRFRTI